MNVNIKDIGMTVWTWDRDQKRALVNGVINIYVS